MPGPSSQTEEKNVSKQSLPSCRLTYFLLLARSPVLLFRRGRHVEPEVLQHVICT